MTKADMNFLISFLKLMKRLVLAMDFLQKEKYCFIGHLVPTIIDLRKQLTQNTDTVMPSLAKALLVGHATRFDPVLNSLEYNLAIMLLPQFRLPRIADDEKIRS